MFSSPIRFVPFVLQCVSILLSRYIYFCKPWIMKYTWKYIIVFILLSILLTIIEYNTVFESNFTVCLVRTPAWMDSVTKNAHMRKMTWFNLLLSFLFFLLPLPFSFVLPLPFFFFESLRFSHPLARIIKAYYTPQIETDPKVSQFFCLGPLIYFFFSFPLIFLLLLPFLFYSSFHFFFFRFPFFLPLSLPSSFNFPFPFSFPSLLFHSSLILFPGFKILWLRLK